MLLQPKQKLKILHTTCRSFSGNHSSSLFLSRWGICLLISPDRIHITSSAALEKWQNIQTEGKNWLPNTFIATAGRGEAGWERRGMLQKFQESRIIYLTTCSVPQLHLIFLQNPHLLVKMWPFKSTFELEGTWSFNLKRIIYTSESGECEILLVLELRQTSLCKIYTCIYRTYWSSTNKYNLITYCAVCITCSNGNFIWSYCVASWRLCSTTNNKIWWIYWNIHYCDLA